MEVRRIGEKIAVIVVSAALILGATACSSMTDHQQSPDGYDANLDPER
jgi:hypothetical protein